MEVNELQLFADGVVFVTEFQGLVLLIPASYSPNNMLMTFNIGSTKSTRFTNRAGS